MGYRVPLSITKSSARMCNEFVADLTGLDIQKKPEEGMSLLKS
jgi:hypothetical protein